MIVHHEGKDYLEIPHGVIDALPPPNLAQHNVVRALVGVLRLRESDETPLPLSQLATLTGLGDSEITRCMKVLEKVAYLHRTYNGSQGSTYRPGLRLRSAYLLGTMLVPLTVLDWSLRELAPVTLRVLLAVVRLYNEAPGATVTHTALSTLSNVAPSAIQTSLTELEARKFVSVHHLPEEHKRKPYQIEPTWRPTR